MKMTTRSLLNTVAFGSATLAMAFGSVKSAQAVDLTLSNTGVGTYTLDVAPAGAVTTLAVIPNGTYPVNGAWIANDTTSYWIGPDTNSANGPIGDYTYTTTFDLTGLIPGTAQISGNWAADNTGVSILLNGSGTGIIANASSVKYGSFTGFSIDNTANFVNGVNSLSFTIGNGGGPTGIRVAMTGTADPAAVPEPSDFVGTAIAFGSVVLLRRNVSKKQNITK
jgi:hypothetical protein